MNIHDNLAKKKEIEQKLIDYLEQNENQNSEAFFQEEFSYFLDDRDELHDFLLLICILANYHHRSHDYFNKIDRLLKFFKDNIIQYFTSWELFHIFWTNKRILLFLFEEEIIKPDKLISKIFINPELENYNYLNYFFNEIKPFLDDEIIKTIEQENSSVIENLGDENDFEKWRKLGENEKYLSQLIRNDSIEEFISYVNKYSISLSKTHILPSIFDTNIKLINCYFSLIEYAAFYGSIQIFKYLFMNNVDITWLIWICAIYGNNQEIIHFLEENNIEIEKKLFLDCFIESIKCHHNDVAYYFKNNILKQNELINNDYTISAIEFCNYSFFPDDLNCSLSLFYFCKYNYISLVKILLNDNNHFDLNSIIVSFRKFKQRNFF